jgi:hypothetical protein
MQYCFILNFEMNGNTRIRTVGHLRAKQVLYQLSYIPKSGAICFKIFVLKEEK